MMTFLHWSSLVLKTPFNHHSTIFKMPSKRISASFLREILDKVDEVTGYDAYVRICFYKKRQIRIEEMQSRRACDQIFFVCERYTILYDGCDEDVSVFIVVD
jgi:hypothetical protein